jgi:hypothetical protein
MGLLPEYSKGNGCQGLLVLLNIQVKTEISILFTDEQLKSIGEIQTGITVKHVR